MGTQAIAGLIHLVGNSFYPPKAAKWDPLSGYSNQPDFKAEIGKEIQDVLRRITGPRYSSIIRSDGMEMPIAQGLSSLRREAKALW